MRIEFQFKTAGSTIEGCPARYRVLDGQGGYVIQGKKLDAATLAMVDDLGTANHSPLADDETAVWVPADIIDP